MKIPNLAPVTDAFLKAGRAGAGWSGFALAAAAAAPAIFSNDDRGYGRTALVTTPLIGAGFVSAPGLWQGLKGAKSDMSGFFNAGPFDIKNGGLKFKSLTDLRDLREAGQLSESQFHALSKHLNTLHTRSAMDYFSSPHSLAKRRSISEMHASVMEMFSSYRGENAAEKMASTEEGVRRNLTMGIFEARLKSSTSVDRMLDRSLVHAPIDSLSFDEIAGALHSGMDMPEGRARIFYENMQHRLTTARDEIVGAQTALDPAAFAAPRLKQINFGADAAGEAFGMVSGQHSSSIAENIQRAVRNHWVTDAKLHVDNGTAVGMSFMRGKESLSFGFVNDKGMMRVGENFGITAAARQVLDAKGQPHDLDSWLIENLDPDKSSFRNLKEELSSFAIYSGRHEDDFMADMLHGLDSDTSFISTAAKARRANEAGYSRMPIFGGRTIYDLSHADRVNLVRQAQANGMTKLGGESSLKHLVFNTADEEKSVLGQLPPLKQTDFTFRSETKPLHLAIDTIPADLRSAVESEEVLNRWGGTAPTVRMNIAGVTPQQKTLFGYLPQDVGKLRDPDVEREALHTIASDLRASGAGLTEAAIQQRSAAAWTALRGEFEADPTKLTAAQKIGSLGEGDVLVSNRYAAIKTEEMGIAHVKSLHVDPSVHGLGTGARPFGPNTVIGFDETGAAVRSAASENWITGVQFNETRGMWDVNYLRQERLETGSKADVLGRKGLLVMSEHGEMETQTALLNMLYERTGRGRPILSDIDALANITSLHSKTKAESFRAMLGNAATAVDTLISDHVTRGQADHFIAGMNRMGLQWDRDRGGFTELSDFVASSFTTDAAKAKRIEDVTAYTHGFFADVERAAESMPTANPLFTGYRSAKQAGLSTGLMEYMHFFNQTGDAWVWDNTRRDIPHQVKTTFDMKSELYRAGEYEVLHEINSGAKSLHGDTRQAWEFLEKFQKMDFNTPLGEIKTLDEIGSVNLSTEGAFTGSILDPHNPEVQKNWSIDLGSEREFVIGKSKVKGRYLPVRGAESYKGAANAYGVGDLASTDYQKSLARMIDAAKGGDPDRFAAQSAQHADEIYKDLLGKGGIFRPDEIYPHAIARAIQTRPSQTMVGEGVHNPFEVVISRNRLHEIHDEDVVKNLMEGKEVYAAAARNPVSSVPMVKVRLGGNADHLGPNMVGIDEGLRSLLQSDDDKDILNLMFLRSQESIARAKKAIAYTGDYAGMSEQWKSVRSMELLQGNLEDSARITTVSRGTLAENIQQSILDVAAPGRGANVEQRLVHGTTGAYSNLLTNLYMNLDVHPTLRWSNDRVLAEKMMWLTRQVPISAGKGKMFLDGDPMDIYHEFFQGIRADNADAGVRLAQDAMTKIALGSGFETTVRDARDLADIESIFGVTQKTEISKAGKLVLDESGQMRKSSLAVGDTFNLYAETMLSGHGGRVVDDFVRNRNRGIDTFVTALTKGEVSAERGTAWLGRMGSEAAPYLTGAHLGARGEAHSVSTALGSINEVLRESAGKIAHGLKPALPVLAAGFGVAALAGLLTTSIEKEGDTERAEERQQRVRESAGGRLAAPEPEARVQQSANQYRPEERIGTPDRIPGQPVEGSNSSRPNVRVTPAPARTRTAVVAPMQRQSDLEVRATAPDRNAAAETARMVQRMSGGSGQSHVVVNHVGGWNRSASKLRKRQQLRDQLEMQQEN